MIDWSIKITHHPILLTWTHSPLTKVVFIVLIEWFFFPMTDSTSNSIVCFYVNCERPKSNANFLDRHCLIFSLWLVLRIKPKSYGGWGDFWKLCLIGTKCACLMPWKLCPFWVRTFMKHSDPDINKNLTFDRHFWRIQNTYVSILAIRHSIVKCSNIFSVKLDFWIILKQCAKWAARYSSC